jgi:hypothetical protein
MSKKSLAIGVALAATLGCASGGGGGGAGATPLPWTPGRYLLEATVGSTLSAEEFTGELIVDSPESITLQSSSGLCDRQTPSDVNQDLANGMRSFNCGPARWEFRPTSGGVRGTIRATILEEVREETPCPPLQLPPCFIMRTRQVTRSATVRVSPIN